MKGVVDPGKTKVGTHATLRAKQFSEASGGSPTEGQQN